MNIIKWVGVIIAILCISAGIIFYVIQYIGAFRFRYVLTRMHAAAIGDTLGGGLILLGTIILNGFDMASAKLIFIIVFYWLTSPVAAHMVARLEVMSKKNMEECCPVEDAEDIKEDAS